MISFIPTDWYWFVGGDETKAYSSKRNIYVDPASDADYADWKAITQRDAVQIASEAELWYYIQNLQPAWMFDGTTFSQPAEGAYTQPQLWGYSDKVRLDTLSEGIIAEGIPIKTDIDSQQRITNARTAAEADPQYTTTIVGTDGVTYPVDAPKIILISDDFLAHATDMADTHAQVHTDVESGTITTLAQIDAAYAAGVRREIQDGSRNHYHRK